MNESLYFFGRFLALVDLAFASKGYEDAVYAARTHAAGKPWIKRWDSAKARYMIGGDRCTWLVVERINTEDGPLEREIECGGAIQVDTYPEGLGWTCEYGHSHQPLERELGAGGAAWKREQRARRDWRDLGIDEGAG